MRIGLVPSPGGVGVFAGLALAAAAALLLQVPLAIVAGASAAIAGAVLVAAIADVVASRSAWRAAPLQWTRALPAAFAVGVRRPLGASLSNPGTRRWRVALFDGVDASVDVDGLPFTGEVAAGTSIEIGYHVLPRRRGRISFDPATLRVRTRLGAFDLVVRAGEIETRHVYPNFAAVARYAWLAGDHRLAEIGIKSVAQRGAGTDFKQLSDYRSGDAIRDIDWKATLRQRRPIVREYQDERDQSVVFLLDCGRRMRADDGPGARRASHFDEALDALMLLAYVALRDGDEVGALTFGTPPEQTRRFAPRKGVNALNALIGTLYDIEPEATHSDYVAAASELLRWRSKRSLIVVLTNFRDEDASELGPALELLRTRHLVLLASLRERALRELSEQPLVTHRHAIEAAGAHLFAQARDDAFARLAARDALLLDVEPQHLAPELVNRYRAVKRAGLL